ncbi:MAG TPA: aminopeptidase P family N-terminal domain-containing protein, partial [Candidatus Limnocylindria bacterium]
MPAERLTYHSRREQASEALRARGIAALLLSPSSDLAYLAGYRVHTSERLTCLVVGADGGATLLVPELESPRAKAAAPDLTQRTWSETDDPYALVASLVTEKGDVAVADQ